jgi:hypothetical protein
MSSYLTTATAASTYYLQTNPSGFQTAGDVTTALSPYLLSATAASTYAVIAAGQPTGGTVGQVLTKQSGANYDSSWATLIPGDRYLTTSTTSNTVSNGNKTFTIGTGLSYTPTQNITISYDASNHMHGEVLTYNSGTGVLTVDINNHTGSGTYTAWVVNVGGVTPATSVAWGAITGVLASQLDLQGALDLKLDVTTAASTYYPQTNPSGFIDASALTGYATETFVTTQGYITQATADGLYYPLSGNPSAFIDASALAPYLTSTAALAYFSPINSPTFTGTPSLPTGTVAVTQAANNNTTAVATTAYVINQAYARLASPIFSGSPSLPTGTIAVTQTAGNNTTAVATTAFVTAAVPAYATAAQGRSAISTTTAMNPSVTAWQRMFPGSVDIVRTSLSYTASGTMGTTGTGFLSSRMTLGTAGACSANFRTFGASQIDQAYGLWSQNYRSYVNFSKFIWCSGRFYTEDNFTDPNVTVGFYCGKAQNSANGDLARAGFGWKFSGNATAANRKFVVCAHNGTTLTTVTSSFAIVAQQYVDWDVVSNGSGTVTLYINGNQVATTTGGPTADTSYSGTAPVIWNEEMITTTVSAGFNATFGRGRFYMAP